MTRPSQYCSLQLEPGTWDAVKAGDYLDSFVSTGDNYNDWVNGMYKDIFGEDADLYRPERWIDADQERKVRLRQCVDVVFGSGRWLCLGRHVAMMELGKALAEVSSHGRIVHP